ncbi:MAG: helix-turn-helix domain-containing protein [Burkholderiales bacterium]
MKPAKKRPQAAATAGANTKGKSRQRFSAKSTKSEAQRERILAALRVGPKTSYEFRRLGCYQAPARIKELRDKFGYSIETERVTLYDQDGYMHPRAARYHLRGEPEGARR